MTDKRIQRRSDPGNFMALEHQAELSTLFLRHDKRYMEAAVDMIPGWRDGDSPDNWCDMAGGMLWLAETFHVSSHMTDVIEGTMNTLPSYPLTIHNIPAPIGWVYLAKPISWPFVQEKWRESLQGHVLIRGFAWSAVPHTTCAAGVEADYYGLCPNCKKRHLDSLYLITFVEFRDMGADSISGILPGNGILMPFQAGIPWDKTLVEDVSPWKAELGLDTIKAKDLIDESAGGLRFFITFLAMLEQKCVITHSDNQPSRPTRKRMARMGWESRQEVKTVLLRSYVYEKQDFDAVAEHRDVDWQCQWWVKSHWRDQWYPNLQTHKPVLIMPYTKGPEGMPFKAPNKTLYDVVR